MNSSPLNQTLPTFDELVELAEHHPDAFLQLKKDMCEEMILSASSEMQERLWAQQSHIDRVVSQCKNPNQTNVLLMQELSLQVFKFRNALEGEATEPTQTADIIPFKPRSDDWR
ncbi:DUF3135 domain-containing protein [Vibrio paucivorans]